MDWFSNENGQLEMNERFSLDKNWNDQLNWQDLTNLPIKL
jgi:hypothetical protein